MSAFTQYLIWIGLAGFLVILLVLFIQLEKQKREQRKAFGQSTSFNGNAKFNEIAQKSYNVFFRIVGVRRLVLNVRRRLETLSIYDEYTLRREVMKIIFTIIGTVLLIALLLIAFRPSWLVIFWVLLGVLFISGILIDFFVYRVEARLLSQLKEYNNRVRFFYQQTKMVDEAIFDSLQFVGPEMRIQGENIHNILTSLEPEKELARYEEVAPTRFLKVIAGLSLLVSTQGDKFDDDRGSAYLRGLNAINQELNNEILYRSKLSYRLRSLSTLSLIPIFFALPFKNWAVDNFPIMQTFYDSRLGFLIEVLAYTIAICCYLGIRKMREVSETTHQARLNRLRWEEILLKKVPFLLKVTKVFGPAPYSKKYFKLQKLIKDANSPLKIDWLTLQRILLVITAFVVLISGFIFAHYREKDRALNNSLQANLFTGEVSEMELKEAAKQTAFDKEVIAKIKSAELVTENDLKEYIADSTNSPKNSPKVIETYNRIVEKWAIVKSDFFLWWELFIAIIIALFVGYIPIFTLQFKRYLRYKDMEAEVYQLLILISSLKEFDNMSVYIILTWIERFTIIFKEPVQVALQDYDSGPEQALDELTNNVSFEPFQQIVERLRLAVIRISIKEAFDDIDTEREYYLEHRKEMQERTLDSKGTMGNMLGFIPVSALVLLYLVIPLIYIAVRESGKVASYF